MRLSLHDPRLLALAALSCLVTLTGCPTDDDDKDQNYLLVDTLTDGINNDDGMTSLAEAVFYARDNGGTVTFADGLAGEIKLADTLALVGSEAGPDGKGEVVIQGPTDRTITLSGGKARRLFVVDGLTLSLSNLTVRDGLSGDNENGGAIRVKAGALKLTSVVFDANVQQGTIGSGGAIGMEGDATLEATGSTFKNNLTTGNGGAIFHAGPGGAITITSGAFEANGPKDGAETWGGGIYTAAATLTVTDTTFKANVSTRGGGVAVARGASDPAATVTISGSSFEGHGGEYAGGLYLETNTDANDQLVATITSCTFLKNSVGNGGGAIHADAGTKAVISGSTFEENATTADAGAGGGAIRSDGTLEVATSTFDKNTSANLGGAIHSTGVLRTDDVQVTNGSATDGGGIYAAGNTADIKATTLTSNTASRYGGGLHLGAATSTVAGSTITMNTATELGGGFYASRSASIADTTISGNTSGFGGGGATSDGTTLSLTGSTSITGNTATKDPGSLKAGGGVCNDGDVTGASLVTGNTPDDFCAPDKTS